MRALAIVIFAVVFGVFNICFADIYKYQDEQGRWHFSDRPIKGKGVTVKSEEPRKKKSPTRNAKKQLYKKYQPQTPIEEATLAVVYIKSSMTQGSGFFASDDGYIITNKHVVKPSESTEWKKLVESVEEKEKAYMDVKKEFKKAGAELEHMERQLEEYREAIENETASYRRQIMESEYRYYGQRFAEREQEYKKTKRTFDNRFREFKKARSEFNWKSSVALLSKRFKITLKDETELSAQLVSVSKTHDLALLKIDGYKTPFLTSIPKTLRQGMTVYAIGSPYGIRDAVTSGIITRVHQDGYIVTDAQILPGNSGGPLLSEEGLVLGVNTLKVAKFVSSEGFGLAIPIDVAKREFKRHLELK